MLLYPPARMAWASVINSDSPLVRHRDVDAVVLILVVAKDDVARDDVRDAVKARDLFHIGNRQSAAEARHHHDAVGGNALQELPETRADAAHHAEEQKRDRDRKQREYAARTFAPKRGPDEREPLHAASARSLTI